MINFLHTFLPNPIIFQLGPLAFRWYGLLMVTALLVGVFVASRLAERYNIASRQHVYDLAFYIILGGLLGARIYAVFLELPFYLAHPFEIIAVWHGGLAIHGGLIGGVLGLFLFRKKLASTRPREGDLNAGDQGPVTSVTSLRPGHCSLVTLTDLLAPAVALGQAIGRWGNYFNQELFGSPTGLPWGIPIAPDNRPLAYMAYDYFHPTFLYESALNLVNFFVLFFVFQRIYRVGTSDEERVTRTAGITTSSLIPRPSSLSHGIITALYLINYGAIRLLMEQFRIDHTPALYGVRWPIIVSGLLIALGVCALVRSVRLRRAVDV